MAEGIDSEFLRSVFLMEAWDTLAAVEEGLRALKGTPADGGAESLEKLRVVTHRLRGAAALNGFPQVAALATAMEETVESAAGASPAARARAVDALGNMQGWLKTALDSIGTAGTENAAALAAALARRAPETVGEPGGETARRLAELDGFFGGKADVTEYFVPEAVEHLESMVQSLIALESAGASEAEIATLFRAVHTLKGAAYTVGCAVIGDLAHRIEDVLGEVRDHRRPLSQPTLEAAFAGLDALRLLVRSAEGAVAGRAEAYDHAQALLAALPSVETLAVEAPRVEAPAAALETVPAEASGEPPAGDDARPRFEPVRAALRAEPAHPRADEGGRPARPSIRVNLDRLDALMSLAGELVIARSRLERHLVQFEQVGELLSFTQSRMAHTVAEFELKYANPQWPRGELAADGGLVEEPAAPGPAVPLGDVFAELEFDRYDDFNILARRVGEISSDLAEVQVQLAGLVRAVRADTTRVQQLSGELRSEIARARMVPVGRLFARFVRQVREAARAAGKTVAVEVSGEAVEMDNTLVEQIADPLLHLARNAVAHGIETEEERRREGKPAHGTIYLGAAQKGASIYVEVADDGRGIDAETLREAAERGGFVKPELLRELGEHDLLDLIFLPGFSTAESVTAAAGRGVGMDVVRTNVGRLGGEIEVQTEVGRGTRFKIKLPLTVVISDALLVRVGPEVLAIPVPAVKAIVRARREEIQSAGGAESLEVEGKRADLVRLDRVLAIPSAGVDGPLPVVALRTGRKTLAVSVDELLGKEEIVVKRLGAFLEGVGPFSGATVTGDGRVILLLDPARLLETSGAAMPAQGAMAETGGERDAPAARAADERGCVLLVDDSVSVRKFVGAMLGRAGFGVVTANDGAEALQRLAARSVDVVVTDLEMPRLNGYELIRDLARHPATRHLPVVVLTTRAGAKHMNLARELGVEHYVAKPVDEAAFVQLIESLMVPQPAGQAV